MENYEDGNAGNLPFLLLSILLLNFSRLMRIVFLVSMGKLDAIFIWQSLFSNVFLYIYVKYNEDVIKD